MGQISIAKKMILELKKAGIQYVKFQKRNNKVLLTKKNTTNPILSQKILMVLLMENIEIILRI